MPQIKTCVIYHYFEANATYAKNFKHFLTFGTSIDADIFCVISERCSFKLPRIKNVYYLYTKNHNYDYGAYAWALDKEIPIQDYEYFVFVNSSIRGPYLPSYTSTPWTLPFIEKLSNEIGLVGSSITILQGHTQFEKDFKHQGASSHVQSMVYAIKKNHLKFLIKKGLFKRDLTLSKDELISRYEIAMSHHTLQHGLNIQCLLPEYNSIDYRKPHHEINPTAHNGDSQFPHAYFGRTPHPYEVIFIKTNRKLWPEYYLDSLSYAMLRSGHYQNHAHLDLSVKHFLKEKHKNELKFQWMLFIKSLIRKIRH